MGNASKAHSTNSTARARSKQKVNDRLADPLTRRETHLLALLETELRYSEIAARLGVSPNTMKSHVKSIFLKLGVKSRHGAVAWHLRRLLTPQGD